MSPQGEESEIVALYLFKNEDYYYLLLIGVDAVMEPNQHILWGSDVLKTFSDPI